VVLLGTPTVESSRLYALSVTSGDPAWAGALAGVALGLPVFHITEADLKAAIPPQAYETHVALMELVMPAAEIGDAVRAVREHGG
jgi:hypothetical protein